MNRYLAGRGDERVKDWASWVPNAKFKSETERRGAELQALRSSTTFRIVRRIGRVMARVRR